jgi:hypothetical protein
VLLLWYGTNHYPASIAPPWGFNFMGEINNLITLRCLQHIRNLELTMTVLLPRSSLFSSPNMLPSDVYYQPVGSSTYQTGRQRTKGLEIHGLFLKECFRYGTHLSRLKLRIDLSRIEFDSYVGRSGKLRGDFAREMAPVRGVRGLEDVEIETGLFLQRKSAPEDLLDVIHELLGGLKVDMISPFTNIKS